MMWSTWFAGLTDAGTSDRMYNCLPMYHSVGGVVAKDDGGGGSESGGGGRVHGANARIVAGIFG